MKVGPGDASAFYAFLDRETDAAAGGAMGFGNLIACQPVRLDPATLSGFFDRYAVIRRFQERTLDLFRASLRQEADPLIADLLLGDVPGHLAHDYHRRLSPAQMRPPLFFRTDEPVAGRLAEIQCPGSAWSVHAQLRALYLAHPDAFGLPTAFARSLPERFAADTRAVLGEEPRIHYLIDNASRPHDARYWIQKTRALGLRYASWDRDVAPRDCNLVRSHDWVSLANDNFHRDHLAACEAGRLSYDLSPCAPFDSKLILALPFDPRTRACYDDEIRSILPHTQVVRPEGILSPEGARITLDDICNTASLRRNLYVKYAGTDVNFNWGSRAVYYLGSMNMPPTRRLFDRILADAGGGRHWVVQQACRQPHSVDYYTRDGAVSNLSGYLKLSAFYGPSGLLGILAYALRSSKVHGSNDTIAGLVY